MASRIARSLAAGFLYGPVLGTAIVSPVSVAAATCSFLLGRIPGA